jgi:hypothetical protein
MTFRLSGILALVLAAIALGGLASAWFHSGPTLSPDEAPAETARHARECEKWTDNAQALPGSFGSYEMYQDTREGCWNDWRELQKQAEGPQ